jgi:hypothetical protein
LKFEKQIPTMDDSVVFLEIYVPKKGGKNVPKKGGKIAIILRSCKYSCY